MPPSPRHATAIALVRSHQAGGVDSAALARALELFRVEVVPDGTVLYQQGALAHEIQLLLHGAVSVRVQPDGSEVARVDAPAIIGHLGVLTGLPRSATVSARGQLELGRLTDRELWRLVENGGAEGVALRRLMLASLVGLMLSTNERLLDHVAERGLPVSRPAAARAKAKQGDTPPAEPRQRRRARPQDLGASESWGFDEDLLRAADEIKVVQSESDKARKYKR